MGNAPDRTIDKKLMLKNQEMMDHFSSEDPLFHVQEIKFPLSTDQMKIVDATGRRVKLAGGNWSGGHMCRHCVDGLQCRPLRDIAMDIRFKFKMNVIRLTYSLQLIYDNNVVPQKYLKANPQLKGKTALQIFDITVKVLTEVGLMVLLNNHTSTSQWCCSNDDGDGLWWSRQYPQYMFFDHVRDFAKKYKDNQRVIGMDMRNQIRKANGLEPTWGDGNPKTDWKRAAQISSQIALKQAPHWLIVIGGLNYQLDLSMMKQYPIVLSVPNKLVYSGHIYGFSWPIPSWQLYSYDNFKKRYFNTQTYVRSLGVPFLIGEYGNNTQDIFWNYLMQYLGQTDIDWTYWALDGFKCEPEKDQTYGVFTNDFSDARHPEMLKDMIKVGPPKSALATYQKYKILKKQSSKVQQGQKSLKLQGYKRPQKQQKSSSLAHERFERQQKPFAKVYQNVQKQYKLASKVGHRPTQTVEKQYKISNNPPKNTASEDSGFVLNQKKQDTLSQKKKNYFEQMAAYSQAQNPQPTQKETINQQYGNQFGSQYGSQYGNQYSSQYGNQYGNQYSGNQYGNANQYGHGGNQQYQQSHQYNNTNYPQHQKDSNQTYQSYTTKNQQPSHDQDYHYQAQSYIKNPNDPKYTNPLGKKY